MFRRRVWIPLGTIVLSVQLFAAEPLVRQQPGRFGHEGAVSSVALSSDGKLLATCAGDKRVHLWDVAAAKELGPFPALKEAVLAVALAPDGKTLVSGGADKTIRFWQIDPVKQLGQVEVKNGAVEAVAYSPDGKSIASGGADRMVRLWESSDPKEPRILTGHQGVVTCIAFSPNGKMLVSGSKDRTVRIWDVESGKEIMRYREHRGWVHAVAFAPDGQSVASAGQDQSIILWDVFAGRQLLKLDSFDGSFFATTFSPDGRVLAAGSKDHTVHFWDLATGKELPPAGSQKGTVLSLAFSKDGKILASASEDGTVVVWNAVDLPRWEKPREDLTAKELDRLWTELAGDQEATAYRALQTLVAQPKRSVEFLGSRLKGVAAPDHARIGKLVADLNNDEFAVREKATEELLGGGEVVEKALRKILKENTLSLEAKRRLEQIVDTQANRPVQDERRRRQAALEVLERIGSDEAKKVLQAFAEGPSEATMTQEAKTALERVAKRAAAKRKPDE